MKKIANTAKDFKKHLKEQIELLQRACKGYDEGYISEAKNIATRLRTILCNSPVSLLKHFSKENMLFYDTALPGSNFLVSAPSLTEISIGSKEGGQYTAPLDDGVPMRYEKGKISFKGWWSTVVIIDTKGNQFSRKQLVTTMANQDGGAHIDSGVDQNYAELTKQNSLGIAVGINGVDKGFATNAAEASIRQIAHEVLKSFKDEFPEYFVV